MIYDLRYYGDRVLREKCKPVEKVTDEIKQLIADMIETMDSKNAIGLAASQIGKLLRIFVIRPYITSDDGEYSLGDPEVYINPVLTSPTDILETTSEGCLSFPGFYPDIERPLGITVEALNEKGEKFKEVIEGFRARQIMHENDHINGVLFIDRLTPKDRKKYQSEIQKIKKKYS